MPPPVRPERKLVNQINLGEYICTYIERCEIKAGKQEHKLSTFLSYAVQYYYYYGSRCAVN